MPKNHSRHQSGLAFLRFANFVQAVRELPVLGLLDPVEERLFHELAALWHLGRPVTVLQAMELRIAGSPSTIHRRLQSLRSKGMIDFESDKVDGRVKYVVSTPKADDYFNKVGQLICDSAAKPG